MTPWRTRFLFLAFGLALAPGRIEADPVTIGGPGTAVNCIPFGCRDAVRYQQIYPGSAFPSPYSITSIAFPHTLYRMSSEIDPADYEIRLSTTPLPPGGAGVYPVSSATVVFSGFLSGSVPQGGALTFRLPVAFNFDPSAGHLLLDVVKRGGVFFGDDGIYLDGNFHSAGGSTALWQDRQGQIFSAGPLVTVFNGDQAPVPEPATLVLLTTGLAGSLAARRRRRHQL